MTDHNRLWSLSGATLLALSLVALWVWPKVFGLEVHPIFGWLEAQSGLTWFEPGGRWAFAAVALTVAVLVLWERTRLAASAAALAMSLAFVVLHTSPWLGMDIPSYGPLMEALAQGRTAAEIQAMNLPTDRGAHFTLALTNAGLAAMTLLAQLAVGRREPRAYRPMTLETA